MTIAELLREAAALLAAAGVDGPRTDARLLLQHVLGLDHARLISMDGAPVAPEEQERYAALVGRRAAGEPVSRIVGRRSFFGLELRVTPDVLDPRPDTELLVEKALEAAPDGPFAFADIGTGSGAIAIAILAARPGARAFACDISQAALEVARSNAVEAGVGDRVEFVLSDYLSAVPERLDLIVSNPPYIPSAEIGALDREVRLHDPRGALDGGADGLDAYRILLDQGASRLHAGGSMHLELGAGQAADVCALAAGSGWTVAGLARDLGGVERVLSLRPGHGAEARREIGKNSLGNGNRTI